MAPRKGYRACRKCGRNRHTRFYVSERARVCADCQKKRRQYNGRDARLQETYGITEDQYKAMFAAQGEACAICKGRRRGNLDVDHCHRTGLVRGLLCRRCNRRLLPAAQDSIERLDAAKAYLYSPPAIETIGETIVPSMLDVADATGDIIVSPSPE